MSNTLAPAPADNKGGADAKSSDGSAAPASGGGDSTDSGDSGGSASGGDNSSGGGGGSGDTTSYTVRKGDTLMMIAFQTYGDLYKWKQIYEANKDKIKDPNQIPSGTVLNLSKPASDPQIDRNGEKYLIKKGDTLGSISNQVYGTPKKWKKLWRNNKQLIKDPNHIFAGFYLYYLPDGNNDVKGSTEPMANNGGGDSGAAPDSSGGAAPDAGAGGTAAPDAGGTAAAAPSAGASAPGTAPAAPPPADMRAPSSVGGAMPAVPPGGGGVMPGGSAMPPAAGMPPGAATPGAPHP